VRSRTRRARFQRRRVVRGHHRQGHAVGVQGLLDLGPQLGQVGLKVQEDGAGRRAGLSMLPWLRSVIGSVVVR